MSKEKTYQRNYKKESIVRIKEGRKISHEKAKEIRALVLMVFILEKILNDIIHLEVIFHMFLDFTGVDNQGLMGLRTLL